jgi:glycosyltransferase involved in cell wall biosynthesis
LPTFSVVLPTYNYGRYVGQAIESVLAQDVPGGVEVIVVDDGSTDDTADVVKRYADRGVQYVWQENRREGAARNNGASRATGDYFAFLDPDDYYLPGKLAADLARFQAPDQPAMVYSRGLNVDPSGHPLGMRRLATHDGDIFWALARESFTPLSTVAVRASAFRECGGFVEDPTLSGTMDWELWMRLAARWPVGFVDHAATCIRVHPSNMSKDPAWMERAMLSGVRHALSDGAVARRVGRRSGEVWSHMYVTIALNGHANGSPAIRTWRWLARAVRAWPPQILDTRFLGAAARAVAGRGALRAVKAAASGRPAAKGLATR